MEFTYHLDTRSYQIGMINSFVEMVSCGVKPLAISPPILPEDLPLMEAASEKICEGFQVHYYVEQSLMVSALQSAEFTKGANSILYYKDPAVLETYLSLKRQMEGLDQSPAGEDKKLELSVTFGHLLGYSDQVIRQKVASGQDMPFMLKEE